MPAPSTFSATSEFGGTFVAASLFDATVSDANVGVTVFGVSDNQWAGVGPGPHQVFMDFGTPVTANGLAYRSERAVSQETTIKWGRSTYGSAIPPSAERCQ